mmetsp:Transcript_50069/g.126215  ORF Transcript_50069/g.126215 Transcript_50069/m.126215 type:complete len:147 (-) Transcript_50069:263-703(-)
MARVSIGLCLLCMLAARSEARNVAVLNTCSSDPSDYNCVAYEVVAQMQQENSQNSFTAGNTTTSACTSWLAANADSTDIVVVMGSQWEDCLANAPNYQTTWFLGVDACVHSSNVFCHSSEPEADQLGRLIYVSKLILHITRALPPM